MGGVPSCPVEFDQAQTGFGCVPKCPTDKGFKVVGPVCAYNGDPQLSVPLQVAPIAIIPDGKIVSFTTLPNAPIYGEVLKNFSDRIAIVQGKVDKETKIATAFRHMQDAENAQDISPEAYQKARAEYYTMVKGDDWIETEKTRIGNVETKPLVDRFIAQFKDLTNQQNQQSTTMDLLQIAQDKFMGVEKELSYSVENVDKQIKTLQDRILINKHKHAAETSYGAWIDMILNIAIVLGFLFTIYAVYRKVSKSSGQFIAAIPPTVNPY